jgi:hypothetical protein
MAADRSLMIVALKEGLEENARPSNPPQSYIKPVSPYSTAVRTTSLSFNMGQCASRLSSKRGISNEEEALSPVPTNQEHPDDLRKATPESTQAQAGEQLDADDKNNTTLQANPQPIDTEDIKYELFKTLKSKEVGEEGKLIILPEDVKGIWARTYYRRFYTSQVWYNSAWDKTDFMDQFIQIMSILIRIDFGKWERFRAVFIDRRDRRDGDLPFDLEELQEENFLGKVTGSIFHAAQFAFCPIQIPQQEDEFILDRERRLPWIDNPELIGEGAFGKVTKRTVAKGFLHYQDVTVNSRVSCYFRPRASRISLTTPLGQSCCRQDLVRRKCTQRRVQESEGAARMPQRSQTNYGQPRHDGRQVGPGKHLSYCLRIGRVRP